MSRDKREHLRAIDGGKDPAVSPLLDRLASAASPDDTRPPEQVLADLDKLVRELEGIAATRAQHAAIARTWQAVTRARQDVRTKGIGELPELRRALDAHRRALGLPEPPAPRRRFGLADVLADLPPVPSVCRRLEWEVGRPPMLVGAPGAGKTYVVLAAMIDLAVGRSLWACPDFQVTRLRVRSLFIDLDQGARKTLYRMKRLLRGHGVAAKTLDEARRQLATIYKLELDELGDFEVDEGEGLRLRSLDEDDLARWRAAWVEAVRGYHFCAVDSLRRLAPFLDENDSRVSLVPDILRGVAEETGCVILLLHHASKKRQDQQGRQQTAGTRGSSAIDGAAGTQIVIEPEDEARRVTQVRAGEAAKIPAFYLAFEDAPPSEEDGLRGIRVVYKTLEQVRAPEKGAKQAKLRALAVRALGWIRSENLRGRGVRGKKQVVANLEGNDGLIYAAVDLLLDEGAIVDVPERDPASGKKHPRLWAADLAPKKEES